MVITCTEGREVLHVPASRANPINIAALPDDATRRYAHAVLTPSTRSPLPLLSELMAEDRAAGVPFIEAWRANVSCACHHAGTREWLRAVLGTERAWRRAYESAADGGLQRLDFESLMSDEP